MAKKLPVINWFERGKDKTAGLREQVTDRRFFSTIRLGGKWANRLHPGQLVAISISDDPKKPKVIGHATVFEVRKKYLADINVNDLVKNIGAKNLAGVWRDLEEVYSKNRLGSFPTVSVITLRGSLNPMVRIRA